jgi:hypothetical protein
MKLIIENIDKMRRVQLPQNLNSKGLWEVDNILTENSAYHFIMQRWWGSKINYVCKLSINRTADEYYYDADCAGDLKYFYPIKIDGNKTIHYLTRDELKDMNKVMNKFSDILNRIPIN